jgi:acetoacetate decarboxylase
MNIEQTRDTAFAMPLTSPSYPVGPYRYIGREYLNITYRTDPAALEAVVPEPLAPAGDTVVYQFVRMPDSTGFGHYSGSAQVIPVRLGADGEVGGYIHAMYLDTHPPISGGRELWGFPQKLAKPVLAVERDTLVGKLDFGPVRVATGTMGFKHFRLDEDAAMAGLRQPGFLLKIIPHVDGSPRICELVRYRLSGLVFRGGWTGPAALSLTPHALAPVADLPVREVISATHVIADLTLDLGEVVHDYLA